MNRTLRTAVLVAVGLAVLWLAYEARGVVTPLLAALLLAYVLDPVVRRMEGRGLSRPVASAVVVAVALTSILVVATLSAQRLVYEVGVFYEDVVGEPHTFDEPTPAVEARLAGRSDAPVRTATWQRRPVLYLDLDGNGRFDPGYALDGVERLEAFLTERQLQGALDDALDSLLTVGPKLADSAGTALEAATDAGLSAVSTLLGLLTLLVLFPIYLYFSLVNLQRVYDVTVTHLPEVQRGPIVAILGQVNVTLSSFFRGRLTVLLIKLVLLLALFVVCDVPLALACAVFAAVASLVPVLGGIAGMAPPILLSVSADSSGGFLAALVIGLVVIEAFEGYVLIPRTIGRKVGLHPLTVLVATFVGGDLLGIFGMLVAIPAAAVVKIVLVEWVLPDVRDWAGLRDHVGEDDYTLETMDVVPEPGDGPGE